MPRVRLFGFHLLAVTVLCLSSPSVQADEPNPALQRRFVEGMSRVESRIRNLSFRAKCKHVSQTIDRGTGMTGGRRAADGSQRQEFECAIHQSGALRRRTLSNATVELQARNETYAFILLTPSEGAASLRFVEPLGVSPSVDERVASIETAVRNAVFAAYHPCDVPLYDLVNNDSFTIKSLSRVADAGPGKVRLEYEFDYLDERGDPYASYSNAHLILDQENEWAILEHVATIQTQFNQSRYVERSLLEYGETLEGVPVATRVERHLKFPDSPGSEVKLVATTEIVSHDVLPGEFFLSHYGLPEPNFETQFEGALKDSFRHQNTWLVILLLAACGLILAGFLWRRSC